MPVHSYFVFIGFTFLFVIFDLQIMRLRKNGSELIGTPTIEKFYFYSGKITIFTTWALFIVKAINPRLGYISMPTYLSWVAIGLLYLGIFIFSLAIITLGKSLAVGLPAQKTTLHTRGIYRLSRNPLYVGVHMIAMASCIYFPDLINISFTLYGIYIHHQIIKQEERFLSDRFGEEWLIYNIKVNRYI